MTRGGDPEGFVLGEREAVDADRLMDPVRDPERWGDPDGGHAER